MKTNNNRSKMSVKEGLKYVLSGFFVGLISMGLGYTVTKQLMKNYIVNYQNPIAGQEQYIKPLEASQDNIVYMDKSVAIHDDTIKNELRVRGNQGNSNTSLGTKLSTTSEDVYILPPVEVGKSHRSRSRNILQNNSSNTETPDVEIPEAESPDTDNPDTENPENPDNDQVVEDLRKLLASINEVIQTKKNIITEEKNLISESTYDINESKDGVVTNKADRDQLNENISAHKNYLAENKADLEELKGMRSDIVYDITGVRNSITGMRMTIEDYGKLLASIKEKIQGNKELLATVKTDTTNAKADLSTIVDSLKINVANKKQSLSDIEESKTLITKDRDTRDSLKKDIQENSDIITALKSTIDEFKDVKTNYLAKKDDLSQEQDKLDAVGAEITNITNNITNNNVLKEDYKVKIKEAIIDGNYTDVVKYTSMLNDVYTETVKLEHTLEYKEKVASTINETIEQKTTDLDDYKENTYDPLKTDFDRAKPVLIEARNSNTELKEQLTDVNTSLDTHLKDLEQNKADKLLAVSNIQDLRNEKPLKKTELENLKNYRDGIITIKKNLLVVKNDYIQNIASARASLKESKEKLASAKGNLQETKANIHMYKNDKLGYKEKIQQYRADKEQAKSSIVLFKKQIADNKSARLEHRSNLANAKSELAINRETKATIKAQLEDLTTANTIHAKSNNNTSILLKSQPYNVSYAHKSKQKNKGLSVKKYKRYHKKSLALRKKNPMKSYNLFKANKRKKAGANKGLYISKVYKKSYDKLTGLSSIKLKNKTLTKLKKQAKKNYKKNSKQLKKDKLSYNRKKVKHMNYSVTRLQPNQPPSATVTIDSIEGVNTNPPANHNQKFHSQFTNKRHTSIFNKGRTRNKSFGKR